MARYADNGNYNATVIVDDDDTGEGAKSFAVSVNNVDPLLDALSDLVVNTGTAFDVKAYFTDPGFKTETFTYSISWGDGTANSTGIASAVDGSPGVLTAGSFGGGHTYATAGLYKVTATVFDDDGGKDTVPFFVTVENLSTAAAVGTSATMTASGPQGLGGLDQAISDISSSDLIPFWSKTSRRFSTLSA